MNLHNETKNNKAAIELTGKIVANPDLAGPILKILEQLGGDVEKLKSLDLSALNSALEDLPESQLSTEQTLTTSPADGRIETIDRHQAVVGQITVNGQQLDTLLSEGSFNKSRSDQREYALKLDRRMATRAENREYVDSLLVKEADELINAAEANALKTYRDRFVRHDQSGLDVDGRRVRVYYGYDYFWRGHGYPHVGALFVRASAESK